MNFPSATLGHARLAIIDVEGGHQPMGFENTWIVFNGEIYNYRAVANEHLKDVNLHTHSDTEVIVQLYRKFGPRAVELLDGMFAFALIQGDEFFMARDPLGIKPLYYGECDGAIYFASEIKALALVTDTIHEFPAGHGVRDHSFSQPKRIFLGGGSSVCREWHFSDHFTKSEYFKDVTMPDGRLDSINSFIQQ